MSLVHAASMLRLRPSIAPISNPCWPRNRMSQRTRRSALAAALRCDASHSDEIGSQKSQGALAPQTNHAVRCVLSLAAGVPKPIAPRHKMLV
jgi:hypothetical protein